MVVEDETQLAGLLGSYLERDGFAIAVVHLRHRLDDDPAQGRYVRTVRGVGYRMGTGQ